MKDILSPREQVVLHLKCIARQRSLRAILWHLQGIGRALKQELSRSELWHCLGLINKITDKD